MNNYDQGFSDYTVLDGGSTRSSTSIGRRYMATVFMWMFLALGISSLFAVLFSSNAALMDSLRTMTERGPRLTGLGWMVSLAPLAFVLIMSYGANRLSLQALTGIFLAYAAVNGISFSFILQIFTAGSLIGCFATASVMFGVMAVLGYTTDKDLTNFGSILTMGLVGIIVAIMVNWFLQSSILNYLISFVGVAVFTGLSAYHVQKLKRFGTALSDGSAAPDSTSRAALYGALILYLDFINLFIMLLQLFGVRRND